MKTAQSLTSGYPLHVLLQDLAASSLVGDVYVSGLATHSRKTKPGDLFIAVTVGGNSGILYINEAVKAGACAVVAEASALPDPYICPVPLYRIHNLWAKAGVIADRFYRHPSSAMTVVGVTGTNGKTTVSHLLAQSLAAPDKGICGLIGTLGYGTPDNLTPGPNTTPEPITLHGLLADMRDRNIRQVVLEVSSHGLDQQRIAGIEFDMAILTNLSRDHLDYHITQENYAAVKRRLFTDYQISQAVINLDDDFGSSLAVELKAEVAGYTLKSRPERGTKHKHHVVSGMIVPGREKKMHMEVDSPWGRALLVSPLLGRFNAYNLLACLAALCLLGHPLDYAVSRLAACRCIPGRMEYFGGDRQPLVVVDYAHTPDALEQVLETLKPACRGKIYCLFGCGGDRDQGKRPLMGMIAERYAHHIILTSDNPRFENPDLIIRDILAGIKNSSQVTVMTDRVAAIEHAVHSAGSDDIVLIAGKGHEEYQEIAGRRLPFSDQQIVRNLLEDRS